MGFRARLWARVVHYIYCTKVIGWLDSPLLRSSLFLFIWHPLALHFCQSLQFSFRSTLPISLMRHVSAQSRKATCDESVFSAHRAWVLSCIANFIKSETAKTYGVQMFKPLTARSQLERIRWRRLARIAGPTRENYCRYIQVMCRSSAPGAVREG